MKKLKFIKTLFVLIYLKIKSNVSVLASYANKDVCEKND
jgi:hypothetical protein